ncbi:MAG TPA: ABC transporter permease [Kofleriaceae bacterium]|nr:ABC transporter permease [Kofleriaceae bacterium]
MLGRKLARELRHQKGQSAAVLVLVALGVMLFIASAGAYVDLRDSYASTRARLALADLHVDVDRLDAAELRAIAVLPGVVTAEVRTVAEVPARIGRRRVELRVLSLPSALDDVLVLSGRRPAADDELLVEKHLAGRHHLHAGDRLELAGREVRITGVAVSAEYLWVARDAADPMPSPDSFGVGWMTAAAGPAAHGAPQLLVDVMPGIDRGEVARAIAARLGPGRVLRATPADQLVGVRLLQLDVDGYQGMAAFFPIFFLGVGAFVVASILARVVDGQRPIIGTLAALGVARSRILVHYLAYGVVLGLAGSLLGAAAGLALAPAMTRAYATELGIPFVAVHLHLALAGWGTLLGVGVSALAGLVPAIRASREAPAAAMRPPRPSTGALARLARRLPAPLPIRMAIRDLLGRPLRSLTTALGVAAAVVVVVATGGLLDSMKATFAATFEDARRDDVRVELRAPAPRAEAEATFAKLAGVARVEGILAAPLALEAGGRRAEAMVQGLAPGATLVRSVDSDGAAMPPSPGGIVLTRSLARALAVHRGDPVDAGAVSLRVDGVADAAMGPIASVLRDDAARALGAGDVVNQVAIAAVPGQAASVRDAVAALPQVARVDDTRAMRAQVDQLMGLGWVMLGAMLVFGGVLAAAILFNTATLGVLERRRDLATLRALGRTQRELGLALTLEHLLLALVGIAIGLPLALFASRRLAAAFSSDLFTLPAVVSPATLAIAIGGILAVLLLAQWPAIRMVGRMSLADAVRTREG